MQSRSPAGKFLIQGLTIAANNRDAGAESRAGTNGRRAKSGAEDQKVNFILSVSNHNSALSDRINSLAVSVDKRNVGKIKGWEVVVMKTWSLTPTRIPRLQFIGYCFVFDNLFHKTTDPFLPGDIKVMQGSDTRGYGVHCNQWWAANATAEGGHLRPRVNHHVDRWRWRDIGHESVKV